MGGPASKAGPALATRRAWSGRLILALLLLDLAWGVLLVFRVPPFGGPDEPLHWYRAQQVSQGHLLARRIGPNNWGGKIDLNAATLVNFVAVSIGSGQPVDRRKTHAFARELAAHGPVPVVVPFPSTASFSPLAYLPSGLGVAIARRAGGDLLAQLHAGRLANLLAYLLLTALTAGLLPRGRWVALGLLSMPAALGAAAAISADPLNDVLPALLVAWCLRLRLDPLARFGWAARIAMLALAVSLGLLKMLAVVLVAVVLLVPARLFTSQRSRWLFALAAIGGCCAAALLWNVAYPFVPGPFWNTGADPHRTMALLMADPFGRIGAMLGFAGRAAEFFWREAYGRFGGGQTPYHVIAPAGFCWAGLAGLAGLIVADAARPARAGTALLLATLAVAYSFLLLLAFRIAYNPPEWDFIVGVQGRYFRGPLLFLALGLMLGLPLALGPRVRSVALQFALPTVVLAQAGSLIYVLAWYRPLWH